jgi:hypothetical protein
MAFGEFAQEGYTGVEGGEMTWCLAFTDWCETGFGCGFCTIMDANTETALLYCRCERLMAAHYEYKMGDYPF